MDITMSGTEHAENSEARRVKRVGLAVAMLTCAAFLIQFFNKIVGTYLPYGALVFAAILVLLLPARKLCISTSFYVSILWIPFLCLVFLHLTSGDFSMNSALDLLTYFTGTVFVFTVGNDSSVFEKAIRVIIIAASIYAISVFIQLLLPPLFRLYLSLLRGNAGSKVLTYRSKYGKLTGFSTNPGFTAGHIVSGLLAYIALFLGREKRLSRTDWGLIIVMFGALILTGKRGHLLGVVFAGLVCYLINSADNKRMRVVSICLIAAAVIIPFMLVFGETLMAIPGVGRFAELFVGLINGEDVTSGRSRLYVYAVKQFLAHPLFGIGWGEFRSSIVGVVTVQTELEVHNIYLQLLCETGLIGFACAVLPMAAFLKKALSNLISLNRRGVRNGTIKIVALFSLGYQLFFLLYGVSGNPLYDYNYVILYFISCAMTATVYREMRIENRESI